MNFNKELTNYVNEFRLKFILAILAGLLASAAVVGQAYFLSKIINGVFLLGETLNNVKALIFIFLFTALARAFLLWLSQYFTSGLAVHLKNLFRTKLINQIGNNGPIALKSEQTGELVNMLHDGVDKLEDYFSKFLPQIFLSVFIPILILIFVFPIDLLTAVIFILTAPIIPLFMYLIGSIAQKMNKKQWESLSRMSAYFFDVLRGLVTIKLFNKTNETIDKIFEVTNSFRIKTMKVLRVAFLSALVLEITSTISVAIIAVSVGLRLLAGNFDFVSALFILIIAPDFYLPLRQLGTSYHAGMEGVAAFERINEILKINVHAKTEIEEKGDFAFDGLSQISFSNVSFTYQEREKKALDNISFTIEPLKVSALVGVTGSGKTTIMNLLLRFINPDEGEILVGNLNLKSTEIEMWRKNISWLPQNPYIFNTTVFENIKLSKTEASIEEIIEAAKKARIHDFILTLPNKYESLIGEDGSKLSGGEIQRIALARAYLRNSKILLVDEPTANLDPIVEEEILKDMYNLFKGKTVLVIAHRLKTISRADKIVTMKDGKIVETGTHEDLLQCGGYYKELITTRNKIL